MSRFEWLAADVCPDCGEEMWQRPTGIRKRCIPCARDHARAATRERRRRAREGIDSWEDFRLLSPDEMRIKREAEGE